MLDRVAQAIALATSACIGFSVLFDWGYFLRIDSRMFSMMSLSDHVAAALERIPLVLFGATIGVLIALFPGPETQWPDQKRQRHMVLFEVGGRGWGPLVPTRRGLVIYTGAFVALLAISELAVQFSVFYLFFLWWEFLVLPVVNRFRAWDIKWLCPFVYFVPTISVMAVTWGMGSAVADLSRGVGTHNLLLTSDERLDNVLVLRSGEHGLYVRDPRIGSNFLLNWSSIEEIRLNNVAGVSKVRGFICRWSGICKSHL